MNDAENIKQTLEKVVDFEQSTKTVKRSTKRKITIAKKEEKTVYLKSLSV